MELEYTRDLKSRAARIVGSNPTSGTKFRVNSMKTKPEIVLLELEKLSLINKDKGFDITFELIDKYIEIYSSISSKSGTKFDLRLARKIASMFLVEYKLYNKLPCKEGFAYIISNPAWPNHYKVGMSKHVKKRLSTYQTYSPFRDYKLEWFGFWFDAKLGEKALRACFNIESHEWVIKDNIDKFKNLSDIY